MRGRPVFPASDSLLRGSSVAPSFTSTPIQAAPYANYTENLRRAHTRIASLPEELCRRSRSPSPAYRGVAKTITAAVVQAGHNPASTKWGQVSRSVAMASTSRRYCGAANGVRVGEKKKVDVGSYEWVLPSTEEEWKECEKKWERRLLGGPSAEGRASKFWSNDPRDATGPSRTDLIRDKVKAWQAKVVPVRTPETQTTVIVSETETQRSTKGKGKETETKRQSPLNFPVAKRTAVIPTSAKGPPPVEPLVPLKRPPSNRSPDQGPAATVVPSHGRDAPRIADLSEMEFLPPSFPTQLKTSTPPVAAGMRARKKPSPIPVCASSPSSSPQLPNVPFNRPPIASSSLSPNHSARLRPTKRPRIRSPLPVATADFPNGPVHNSSSLPPADTVPSRPTKRQRSGSPPLEVTAGSPNGPALKRARIGPDDGPSSSAPPPPCTPPPFTPPVTPSRKVSSGKGLGNAKGIPVPSTPNRPLPTLTDLLASSRRSKPRPRPPSRKPKTPAPEQRRSHEPVNVLQGDPMDVLPVLTETHEVRDASPAPTAASRARTLFSSPASGSSGSPQSVRDRPRSPVSPLFSQQGGFVPPLTSTQFAAGPGPGQGTGLSRGGSGMFGMGYSSQFDVEGQVGMVSELLDRDVDFDGWLRDIPEVETEG